MMTRILGSINPTQLNEIESRVLCAYFRANRERTFFQSGHLHSHSVIVDGIQYQFQLTHPILRRSRDIEYERLVRIDPDFDPFRYEVLGSQIGEKGGMGTIFTSIGRLHDDGCLEQGRFIFKRKKRVVKKQNEDLMPLAIVQKEVAMTKLAKYMHAKELVVADSSTFIVMKLLKDCSLFSLLDHRKMQLDISTCFKLTINILRAVQELHEDSIGIIHRDLKPENIIVNIQSMEVNLLDFGLSKRKNSTISDEISGTLLYCSPEQFNNLPTSEKSDSYSLGKIMAEIWLLNCRSHSVEAQVKFLKQAQLFLREKQKELSDSERANPEFLKEWAEFQAQRAILSEYAKTDEKLDRSKFDLFDFSPLLKNEIHDVIQSMLRVDPLSRLSVDDALQKFEQVKIKFKIEELGINNTINREQLIEANRSGFHARNEYRAVCQGKKKEGRLLQILQTHLNALPDRPDVIKEFLETLGIQTLIGLTSKSEIYRKVSSVFEEANAVVDRIVQLSDVIDSLPGKISKKLRVKRELIFQKEKKWHSHFDDLTKLTDNLKRHEAKLRSATMMADFSNCFGKKIVDENRIPERIAEIMGKAAMLERQLTKEQMEWKEQNPTQTNSPVLAVKWNILHAIVGYLQTVKLKEIKNGTRAASIQRCDDMRDLINMLSSPDNTTVESVISQVKDRIQRIKRGLFNTNVRFFRECGLGSQLMANVEGAIKRFYKNNHDLLVRGSEENCGILNK